MQSPLRFVKRLLYDKIDFKMNKNARYSNEDIINLLIHTSMLSKTINSASKTPDRPTNIHPNTIFHHLYKLDEETTKSLFYKTCEELVKLSTAIVGRRRVDLAVDTHDWQYYGNKDDLGVVGTQHKRGTNYAFKFLTVSIVMAGIRYTLAVEPITDYSKRHEVLNTVFNRILKLVNVGVVYLDSWFSDVPTIKLLKDLGVKFVIQGRMTNRIKRVIKKEDKGKDVIVVKDYETVRKRSSPPLREHVNLIIIPHRSKEGEYTCFLTNLEVDENNALEIAERFRKRWGIETSYRVKVGIRIKTRTKKFNVRLFLFVFSAILYNLWVYYNLRRLLISHDVCKKPAITIFLFLNLLLLKDFG